MLPIPFEYIVGLEQERTNSGNKARRYHLRKPGKKIPSHKVEQKRTISEKEARRYHLRKVGKKVPSRQATFFTKI